MAAEPLVSVGVPTYERASQLRRAAESVLAQTHSNLELVISDNASGDGTEALCRELEARDGRVRYLRQPLNRGPTANFNTLFGEMRGDYAMVLSDDDWLEPGYVEACLAALRARPELALACGVGCYWRDGQPAHTGRELQLEQDDPAARVLAYLEDVDENAVFYGLMPRAVLRRAAPLRNVLGNDWLLAAAVAAQGKLVTLPSARINRELGGTSADIPKLLLTLGLPRWQAFVPQLVIAWQLVAEICRRGDAFRSLAPGRRVSLAARAAWCALDWRSLAWHATMPAFRALGRRRGLGWVWRAYERVTGTLGAGRPG